MPRYFSKGEEMTQPKWKRCLAIGNVVEGCRVVNDNLSKNKKKSKKVSSIILQHWLSIKKMMKMIIYSQKLKRMNVDIKWPTTNF